MTPKQGGPLGAMRELWDRVIASDPGLVRARLGVSAALSMAGVLAVEYLYASAIHDVGKSVLIIMMIGGVICILGTMALPGGGVRRKLRTGVLFPVAFAAGMVPGALVGDRTDLMLCVFVVIMFAAVWVRRFGPAYFSYGFMMWMGYFFATYLGVHLSTVPAFVADVAVAAAVMLLLSITILLPHPGRTLRRVQRAFDARARAVARACADLLEASGDPRRTARAQRRLHDRGLRLAEAALMIEAWSTESGVLPEGWSGPAMRLRLLDSQLAIDELMHAADELAKQGGDLVRPAARVVGHLARREYPAVLYAAQPLLETGPNRDLFDPASRPVSGATSSSTDSVRAIELLDALAALAMPTTKHADDAAFRLEALERVETPASAASRLAQAAVDFVVLETGANDPPDADAPGAEFAPAVPLILGALPGSAAVTGKMAARGAHWNPLSRAPLFTRQAFQVALAGALAIILGRQISETRYYWAVLAAFFTFAGATTRSETSIKAFNRLLGTLLGLGLAIALAETTRGHTPLILAVVILAAMCGFYLLNISYAGMIFFVTIIVAQLYSALGEFTPGFLVLRLEETALGAAIGIVVGLFVLPTSTRDTVNAAERAFRGALAEVLEATANAWEGLPADPAGRIRTMEDRMRQLALTARPLTRTLLPGDNVAMRHRLTLFAEAARRTRALVAVPAPAAAGATSASGVTPLPVADRKAAAVAEACRALAQIVGGLGGEGAGSAPLGAQLKQRSQPRRHAVPRRRAEARPSVRPRR
jgi:uncharacterized membrane protein YccC